MNQWQVYPAKNASGTQQPLWLRLEQNLVVPWRDLRQNGLSALKFMDSNALS